MPNFISKAVTKTAVVNRDLLPDTPTKDEWREAFKAARDATGISNVKAAPTGELLEGTGTPLAFDGPHCVRTTRLCVFEVTEQEYSTAAAIWMAQNSRKEDEPRATYSRRRRRGVAEELFGELQDADVSLDNFFPSMVIVTEKGEKIEDESAA